MFSRILSPFISIFYKNDSRKGHTIVHKMAFVFSFIIFSHTHHHLEFSVEILVLHGLGAFWLCICIYGVRWHEATAACVFLYTYNCIFLISGVKHHDTQSGTWLLECFKTHGDHCCDSAVVSVLWKDGRMDRIARE